MDPQVLLDDVLAAMDPSTDEELDRDLIVHGLQDLATWISNGGEIPIPPLSEE